MKVVIDIALDPTAHEVTLSGRRIATVSELGYVSGPHDGSPDSVTIRVRDMAELFELLSQKVST